jgi:GNAT superfamily N-acetyltransferase
MTRNVRVRRIADGDWDEIVVLEAATYAARGLSEGRAALESKARVSPATCFALDVGPRLAGYLLALPYPEGAFPGLAQRERVVFASRKLHLHDLVIAEDLRGRGLGKRLFGELTTGARGQGYEQISLVAVGGSDTFWSANGFTARDGIADPAGYGPDSVYMTMTLESGRAGGPTPTGGLASRAPSRDEVG